jgi:catechol 2,3-dioxygenase-like lactoylglutathione lyase family enzyme
MPRLRLSHVGICVSDWKRSLRFYCEQLGFRYVSELELAGEPSETLLGLSDLRFRAVYLERDGVVIELLAYESPGTLGDAEPRPMNRLGLTHLSLAVDDLDALLADLARTGVRVLEETRIEVPRARTRAIFVTDPDGTRIELVERPADAGGEP